MRDFDVTDYRYKWAKGLARNIEDRIENKLDMIDDPFESCNFEHLIIREILEYTYQNTN